MVLESARAGIVTLNGNSNYGNRLQNFALQRILKNRLGVTPENVSVQPVVRYRLQRAQFALEALTSHPRILIKGLSMAGKNASSPEPSLGERMLADFSAEHLAFRAAPVRGGSGATTVNDEYDFFIVGSDQVWNPLVTHGDPNYFLGFAQRKKRIAYAASFGVESIPAYMQAGYRGMIDGIPSVSVRERSAQKLVFKLTGRLVPVVLDPSMLLERSEWEVFINAARSEDRSDYVASFFLDSHNQVRTNAMVNHLGCELKQYVKCVSDPSVGIGRTVSPFEFVATIAGAGAVVTDSFHAAAFAILFNRPLFTVRRGDMYSRIEGLTRLVGLGSTDIEAGGSSLGVRETDWDSVNQRIATERSRSLSFLMRAVAEASSDLG